MSDVLTPPHIRLDAVSMKYRTKGREFTAIERVDLAVPRGAFVSVIGPSGCGKSTLLKLVSKVVPAASGTTEVDGSPLDDVDLTGRLSFMFQQPLLLPWRNVLDNVLLPVQIVRRKKPDAQARAAAVRLLETVGLGDSLDRRPHELSGGMRQRVALVRALVTEPEILLMDEPFGAVDEITRESLQEELLRIWQDRAVTILLVTHQIEEAVLLSDWIAVMSKSPGRLLETVPVDIPRPREPEVRKTREFHQLVDHLRGLLRPAERPASEEGAR